MVKDVEPADAEGGQAPFELTSPMRIGLLPLGWGDGFPRVKPDGASALVRGRRVPLLPPVHLEHLRVDLTEVPEARLGDEITLVGRQGEAEIAIGRRWRASGASVRPSSTPSCGTMCRAPISKTGA